MALNIDKEGGEGDNENEIIKKQKIEDRTENYNNIEHMSERKRFDCC